MLATIRRSIEEEEDLDAFAHVCHALSADSLARLRRYRTYEPRRARFSTWLVTVIHNLAIDWVRQRDGRRRVRVPQSLAPFQQEIFVRVFVEQRSHTEAFEILRTGRSDLTFSTFLR